MRGYVRALIYALITAIIEVPSILILYSYGYPGNPSSRASLAWVIAENLYIWFLYGYAVGGPAPGQGPRDTSLDLVWGIMSMFIIVSLLGETINWLVKKIRETKVKTN